MLLAPIASIVLAETCVGATYASMHLCQAQNVPLCQAMLCADFRRRCNIDPIVCGIDVSRAKPEFTAIALLGRGDRNGTSTSFACPLVNESGIPQLKYVSQLMVHSIAFSYISVNAKRGNSNYTIVQHRSLTMNGLRSTADGLRNRITISCVGVGGLRNEVILTKGFVRTLRQT